MCLPNTGITVPAPLEKKKVAVFISGSGTNLQSLIDETQSTKKASRAEIAVVISNKIGVKGLDRARDAGIPTVVIDHKVRYVALDVCALCFLISRRSCSSIIPMCGLCSCQPPCLSCGAAVIMTRIGAHVSSSGLQDPRRVRGGRSYRTRGAQY